jgi:hypothetical protein
MRLRRLRSFATGRVSSTSVTLYRVMSHCQVLGARTPYPPGAPASVRARRLSAPRYFFAATHISADHQGSSLKDACKKALI